MRQNAPEIVGFCRSFVRAPSQLGEVAATLGITGCDGVVVGRGCLGRPWLFRDLDHWIGLEAQDADADDELGVLRFGALTLDLRTRRASAGGRTVELTAREFGLAETFLRHPDQVLSRQQLLSHAWGYDFDPDSNIVDVYVRYLRRKLGEHVIETVRGMGYRLRDHDDP